MKREKIYLLLLFFLLVVLLPMNLILLRAFSPTEIDDLSPQINCPELEKYDPDILWIIPKFEEEPISENKAWCNKILLLNKTLGLHGIGHSYEEFLENITQKDLEEAISIFEECFGSPPTLFKPPQLVLSEQNKKLLGNKGLITKRKFNQLVHKVYHCEDTGIFPNRLIKII